MGELEKRKKQSDVAAYVRKSEKKNVTHSTRDPIGSLPP